jgi:hypothetical protein
MAEEEQREVGEGRPQRGAVVRHVGHEGGEVEVPELVG